jgi:hypothetical protein
MRKSGVFENARRAGHSGAAAFVIGVRVVRYPRDVIRNAPSAAVPLANVRLLRAARRGLSGSNESASVTAAAVCARIGIVTSVTPPSPLPSSAGMA